MLRAFWTNLLAVLVGPDTRAAEIALAQRVVPDPEDRWSRRAPYWAEYDAGWETETGEPLWLHVGAASDADAVRILTEEAR